ncbi:hypothetical protein BDR22DRAFT_886887 [Usnea florida]
MDLRQSPLQMDEWEPYIATDMVACRTLICLNEPDQVRNSSVLQAVDDLISLRNTSVFLFVGDDALLGLVGKVHDTAFRDYQANKASWWRLNTLSHVEFKRFRMYQQDYVDISEGQEETPIGREKCKDGCPPFPIELSQLRNIAIENSRRVYDRDSALLHLSGTEKRPDAELRGSSERTVTIWLSSSLFTSPSLR